MVRHFLWLVIWMSGLALAQAGFAQTAVTPASATLVADSVSLQSPTVLVAKGHVEVFYKGQRLTARQVTYDKTANHLQILGPIRIDDGRGAVMLADQAEMSADLTEGLLTSARVVLDQKLQLAAAEVLRSDGGRYTTMRHVVTSTCTICAGTRHPLWEIRAREVVHDELAQQVWFSDASLSFVGVPVLYLPILRVPDPTLKRATGFMIPKLRTTTQLGTGLVLPYFIVLGPTRDVTLIPYLTNKGDMSLGFGYRQGFNGGLLQINGAITKDSIIPDQTRGYLTVAGDFNLGGGYKLTLDGIAVSDPSYLKDYGLPNLDRLDSTAQLTRVQRNLYFSASVSALRSLRPGESNETNPTALTNLEFHRRFLPAILGGEGEFEFQSFSEYRTSNSPFYAPGADISDGRDTQRITFKGDWRRNWTLRNGIEVSAEADGAADFYAIQQDNIYAGTPYRATATAGVELRWPWVKASANGASQLIEPVIQFVVAPQPSTNIPNEDSLLVEFDESNLFSLDRYPGADAFEGGNHINLGVNYLMTAANGFNVGMTVGRVVRFDDNDVFSTASGLSGSDSDWLLSASLGGMQGLSVTSRVLVGNDLSLTKAETRFDLVRSNLSLSGGYEFLLADASEGRLLPVREIALDGSYKLNRNWTAKITDRYDIVAKSQAAAGLDLSFTNECLSVDLSVSRSYTSSTSGTPGTEIGFTIGLLGFGGTSGSGNASVCRR